MHVKTTPSYAEHNAYPEGSGDWPAYVIMVYDTSNSLCMVHPTANGNHATGSETNIKLGAVAKETDDGWWLRQVLLVDIIQKAPAFTGVLAHAALHTACALYKTPPLVMQQLSPSTTACQQLKNKLQHLPTYRYKVYTGRGSWFTASSTAQLPYGPMKLCSMLLWNLKRNPVPAAAMLLYAYALT